MIFVDMDGVLVDFNGRIRELFGKDFSELNNDWVWEQLLTYDNLYLNLNPMLDYMTLWHTIEHLDPQILTAIPSKVKMPNVMEDKLEWVQKHLGYSVKVNYGPYSKDKHTWCKPGDVLIDDSYLNIEQWRNKGGIGILHRDARSTITELNYILRL